MVNSLVDIRRGVAAGFAGRGCSFLGSTPNPQFYAPRLSRCAGKAIIAALALLGLSLGGCAASGDANQSAADAVSTVPDAPWPYLAPAVWHAAESLEMTVQRSVERGGDSPGRRYALASVRNVTVTVQARRGGQGDDAVIASVDARWAPFRDDQRERALEQRIWRRVGELKAGGGVAP